MFIFILLLNTFLAYFNLKSTHLHASPIRNGRQFSIISFFFLSFGIFFLHILILFIFFHFYFYSFSLYFFRCCFILLLKITFISLTFDVKHTKWSFANGMNGSELSKNERWIAYIQFVLLDFVYLLIDMNKREKTAVANEMFATPFIVSWLIIGLEIAGKNRLYVYSRKIIPSNWN